VNIMYLCPVCGKEIENTVCSACGFDRSCDFEHYPTLSKVSSQALGISNLKKAYENKQKKYISCKNCGGKSFYIDQETHECICTQCSKPLEIKHLPTEPKNENKQQMVDEKDFDDLFSKDLYEIVKSAQQQSNVANAVTMARGLLNICQNQKGEEKQTTTNKIKKLFEKYSFNSELAVIYAKALENLSLTQNSNEKVLTVSEIRKLYEQFKYNELIAFIYAEILVSLSATQDYSEKQKSAEQLKSLYSRFRDSEKIATAYSRTLINLSRDQNIKERHETLLVIKDIYENFKNSEEIAVIYAMTLSNICQLQRKTNLTYSVGTGLFPKKESIDAKTILKNLRSKFPQNRSIRQSAEEINEMSRY